jgi:hypothetical protein
MDTALATTEHAASRIYFIRGQRVMLDSDLAVIYGVETRVLNQAVQRNLDRFPEDFAFRLTTNEFRVLMSQIVTSKHDGDTDGRGGRRKLPYAFTEHGVVMLASVLRSSQAVQASLFVVRAFVQMRQVLNAHQELAKKLEELEAKYDARFHEVFKALRLLLDPEKPERTPIGFAREVANNELAA